MNNEDTEIIEEDLDETASAKIRDTLKKIREELHKCRKEKDQHLDNLQRARADLVNARRIAEQERTEFGNLVRRRVLLEVLEVVDNFERARNVAGENADAFRKGVEQIYGQLVKFLDSYSVVKMNIQGKSFDPAFHESVGDIEVYEADQDHMIQEVVRDGYMINDSVLRAAQVKIGVFKK